MNNKFDNIIKKHIDKNQLPDLSPSFTEMVVREILVNNRKLSIQPLLPKSIVYSIFSIVALIIAFVVYSENSKINYISQNGYSRIFDHSSDILSGIIGFLPDLSILYFLIAAFFLINIYVGNIFHKHSDKIL